MDKRKAYTVSVTSSAHRERLAQRSRELRVEMDRQEFVNKIMSSMNRDDGTEAECLALAEKAASKQTFTGEYRIHY